MVFQRRRAPAAVAVAGALVLGMAFVVPVAAAGPTITVVVSGLDNPRGISAGSDGRIVVAEAGRGGAGAGGFGLSGRIVEIDHGRVRVLLAGLPSILSPEGEVSGPVGVSSTWFGRTSVTIGGGPQGVDSRFDTLLRTNRGRARTVADIQAFRNTHPDTTDLDQPPNPTDSNAYGVAALTRGRTLATDAAGNDLLLVDVHGKVTTVAKFPNELVSTSHLPPFLGIPADIQVPAEAVPTSVTVGPDGFWYVGELKGFPFTPGTSRIWRIAPWARNVVCDPAAAQGACTLFADGFTSIIGLDFGPDGSLYVAEIVKSGVGNLFFGSDSVGALWRLKHGTKSEIAAGALTTPGGVAVGRDGKIYVTNKSIQVGTGEVLLIRP